jgi:hypothetical protein
MENLKYSWKIENFLKKNTENLPVTIVDRAISYETTDTKSSNEANIYSYDNETFKSITFKKFFVEHLGLKEYNDFVISSGYSDYANEDVYEVLYYYQMEDNAPGWTALDISWSKLVSKLCEKIGYQNIITSATSAINNWNILCDHGITIAMSNNMDIKNITETNKELKSKTGLLVNATNILKNKLSQFNLM